MSDGVPYMACEFVEGESLQSKLERRGQFDARQSLAICIYVCEALRHAWDRARIVHRDIKPDNIFLSASGEVKVGDFGLAKSMGAATRGITRTGMTLGTPHYMSPEQARGLKDIDFRADIYSVGCMLFHMLTGRMVYESKSIIEVIQQQAFGMPPLITQIMPDCPGPLAILLNKMLAKDPNQRHESYDALIAEMMHVRERIQAPMNSIARAPAAAAKPLTPRVINPPPPT
jgi:serine/threonine-protein kinase